jgi:hypothetical protein
VTTADRGRPYGGRLSRGILQGRARGIRPNLNPLRGPCALRHLTLLAPSESLLNPACSDTLKNPHSWRRCRIRRPASLYSKYTYMQVMEKARRAVNGRIRRHTLGAAERSSSCFSCSAARSLLAAEPGRTSMSLWLGPPGSVRGGACIRTLRRRGLLQLIGYESAAAIGRTSGSCRSSWLGASFSIYYVPALLQTGFYVMAVIKGIEQKIDSHMLTNRWVARHLGPASPPVSLTRLFTARIFNGNPVVRQRFANLSPYVLTNLSFVDSVCSGPRTLRAGAAEQVELNGYVGL